MNKNIRTILLFSAYIAFMYVLYIRLGIIDTNEAKKYISAAKQIGEGNILSTLKDHLFYSSYVLFLSVLLPLGGVKFVVIIQVILNIIASIFLKKTLNELTNTYRYGIIAQIFFLFCYPIQVWTLSLFSDNFFVCLISISLFYILKNKKERKNLLALVLLSLALLLARPPGIMFIYSYFIYYIYQLRVIKPQILLVYFFAGLFLMLTLIFSLNVEAKGYIKPIVAGAIIIDKPDYNIAEFNHTEKSTLTDAYSFLFKNKGIVYILGLYIKKVISFFTLTRPYYSSSHNLILYFCYLLYPLTLAGIFRLFKSQKKAEGLIILIIIILCANLTGLTYNEWHYRFTIEIFPLLIIASSYYLIVILNKKSMTQPPGKASTLIKYGWHIALPLLFVFNAWIITTYL